MEMSEDVNIQILKLAYHFALESMEFCEKLTVLNKKPIAERVLKSTLSSIGSLQHAIEAERHSNKLKYYSESKRSLENAIYWLEQCQNSGYIFSEKLFNNANKILKFISEKV